MSKKQNYTLCMQLRWLTYARYRLMNLSLILLLPQIHGPYHKCTRIAQ